MTKLDKARKWVSQQHQQWPQRTKQRGQYITLDGTAPLLGMNVLNDAGRSVQYNGWDSTVIRSEYTQQSRVVSTVQWMGQLIRSECTQQSREVSTVQWMGQHFYQEQEQYCGLDTTIIRSKHAQQSTFNGYDTFTRSKCAGHTIITNKAGTGMAVLWVNTPLSPACVLNKARTGMAVLWVNTPLSPACVLNKARTGMAVLWVNTPLSPACVLNKARTGMAVLWVNTPLSPACVLNKARTGMAVLWVNTPLSPACVLNKARTGMAVLWVGQHRNWQWTCREHNWNVKHLHVNLPDYN